MEITLDLETCKIIVSIEKWNSYAVFISKITGETIRMTIPELIEALEKVSYKSDLSDISTIIE